MAFATGAGFGNRLSLALPGSESEVPSPTVTFRRVQTGRNLHFPDGWSSGQSRCLCGHGVLKWKPRLSLIPRVREIP